MFLDFLKKKLQEAVSRTEAPEESPESDYETRRGQAQALFDEGRVSEAVTFLEQLAADLAGQGNFPLAVAVRHQIAEWRPGQDASAAEQARRMAHQRAESGIHARPQRPQMTRSGITRLVSLSPLLEELTEDEIQGLIESTGLAKFEKDAVIVEEGAAGDQLFVVTRGTLRVNITGVDGNSVRVGSLSVGDFFGEVSILTGKPRSATVIADSTAECLQITGERWKLLSARHPNLTQVLEDALRLRAEMAAEAVVDDLRKRRSGIPRTS